MLEYKTGGRKKTACGLRLRPLTLASYRAKVRARAYGDHSADVAALRRFHLNLSPYSLSSDQSPARRAGGDSEARRHVLETTWTI
jgi:hypothetical protein